jgi:phosphoglycerate dehydrogenase-like enzyme
VNQTSLPSTHPQVVRVHLLHTPEPDALEILKKLLDNNIHLSFGADPPERSDYEILVAGRPERRHLIASPRLHTVIIPFAGIPTVTRELLLDFPHFAVHNLHHNAAVTAEMAIGLLLSAAKFIIPCDQALRKNDWRPRYSPPPAMALEGKTALILGYGQIGQRIGRVLRGFGMDIIAVCRRLDKERSLDHPVEIHPVQYLSLLLPRADILIIALPATAETEELIGKKELGRLPEGAVLVNIGRASIIDQEALFHALKNGPLGAAGLDVWYHYPQTEEDRVKTPPADFPFYQLNNIVMSPHRAGSSTETEALRMSHLAVLLNAAARGEEIPNRVNVQLGY